MPRLARLALLALAALALALAAVTASSADACPAPPPGGRCSKYDFMFDQMQLNQYATVYVRKDRAVLAPRVRSARARKLLIGSTWIAGEPNAPSQVLHLFDAAEPPATVETTHRNFLIRAVTWQGDHYEVTLDGIRFAIRRCRGESGLLTTCLVRGAVVR